MNDLTADLSDAGFDNPAISDIPVQENFDTLFEVAAFAGRGLQLDESKRNRDTIGYKPDFRLRAGACQRLVSASQSIPEGYVLLVKDCLRPASYQETIFAQRLARIQAENPRTSPPECRSLCARYIAPPEAAGHTTGGAVDIVLCDSNLTELDMGTAYDEAPETCANACFTDSKIISPAARLNRNILITAMTSAGFVNYPYEWWHWSFGDRYWAFACGKAYAIYSKIV